MLHYRLPLNGFLTLRASTMMVTHFEVCNSGSRQPVPVRCWHLGWLATHLEWYIYLEPCHPQKTIGARSCPRQAAASRLVVAPCSSRGAAAGCSCGIYPHKVKMIYFLNSTQVDKTSLYFMFWIISPNKHYESYPFLVKKSSGTSCVQNPNTWSVLWLGEGQKGSQLS